MDQRITNTHELSDFVSTHDLRDRNSIIHFNAIVSITTAKNKIANSKMEVMISFDNFDSYGQVSLLRSDKDLNPYLYPTVFEAKWQKMEHLDKEHLLISATHTKNPDIGKYIVRIIPLERLRN